MYKDFQSFATISSFLLITLFTDIYLYPIKFFKFCMSAVYSPLSIHTSHSDHSKTLSLAASSSSGKGGVTIDTKLEQHQFISIIGSPPPPSGLYIFYTRSKDDSCHFSNACCKSRGGGRCA